MCVFVLCVILSQAVVVDRTMYISGQLGLDVASGQLVDGGVKAQAKQVRLPTAGMVMIYHYLSTRCQESYCHICYLYWLYIYIYI